MPTCSKSPVALKVPSVMEKPRERLVSRFSFKPRQEGGFKPYREGWVVETRKVIDAQSVVRQLNAVKYEMARYGSRSTVMVCTS
jgi:hypothetical protein